MAAGHRGLGEVEPFSLWRGRFLRLDVDDVAVVERCIEWYHLAVHFCPEDVVADVGVYGVREVHRAGVEGQVDHVAFGGEDEYAMRKDVRAQRRFEVRIVALTL